MFSGSKLFDAAMSSPIVMYLLFFIIGNALSLTKSNDHYNVSENDYSCDTYPPWFTFDKATEKCECGNRLGGIVNCDNEDKRVSISSCYCMTHDVHLGTTAGACMISIAL